MPRMFTSVSFVVRGESMGPTLLDGQRILVDKAAYHHATPARGDVVVFRHRELGTAERVTSVKRVVGLPLEHVQIKEGRVVVDGKPLDEPYAVPADLPQGLPSQWVLGEEQYFLLGDDRRNSYYSHRLGPVDAADVVGKAWLCTWPPSAWGKIR